MGDLYLGLDLSTQSLKSVLIDEQLNLVHSDAVVLDELGYNTTDGFINDGKTITAPTLMFVAAMDRLLDQLSKTSFLPRIKSISASGQQHGTVYWRNGAGSTLSTLNSKLNLTAQLGSAFSKSNSPIWMDTSTKNVCERLTNAVGGAQNLTKITGSSAYERFSINQIFKFACEQADDYRQTERIELISSFVMTLLAGSPVPIDWADGSGMNCFDIEKKCWNEQILQFGKKECGAKDIDQKLQSAVPSETVVGKISPYWTERYSIPAECQLVAATGDNPSSFAGLNIGPGEVCISLGTSDTVFMDMVTPRPQTEGHVFVNPVRKDSYMAMLCYKNGSLIRQKLRDEFKLSWEEFGNKLESTAPTGHLYIRFDYEEITPVLTGTWQFKVHNDKTIQEVEIEESKKIRALIETQIIAKRAHTIKFGLEKGERVIVTGGASSNKEILRVIADVFQLDVYVNESTANSAAMGAAYRAYYSGVSPGEPYDKICEKGVKLTLAAKFDPSLAEHYRRMVVAYTDIEMKLLGQ